MKITMNNSKSSPSSLIIVVLSCLLLASSFLIYSTEGFSPKSNNKSSVTTLLKAEIGDTGVAFENVAREWRCKVRINRIITAPMMTMPVVVVYVSIVSFNVYLSLFFAMISCTFFNPGNPCENIL
jgi:hypothetical protein